MRSLSKATADQAAAQQVAADELEKILATRPDGPEPTRDETVSPLLPYGVGIDTHKAFIQVCILFQQVGAVTRIEQEFQTTWFDLVKARDWVRKELEASGHLKPDELMRYTIESTGCYHMPVCQAFGGVPTIINPVLAGPTRRKTDVLDARMLARHSIIALWRASYVLTEENEILRCLVAMRNECVRNSSRAINRVNNHLLRFGHTVGREGTLSDMQRRGLVEDMVQGRVPTHSSISPRGLPLASRSIFHDSYQIYDRFKALGAEYLKAALQYVASKQWPKGDGLIGGRELMEVLQSVPGVGPISALIWLSVIGDPRRFEDKGQVAAFCGADPSVKVSAGKTTSHTKRKGNARLHHTLKNCASMLVRNHKEPIGQWGYSMMKRNRKGGWGRSISAVARRLSIMLWHVHRTGAMFSYEQYRFYLAPDVPEVPLVEMNLHERYHAMLRDLGLKTSGEVVRAFMTTLPQQKGIGAGCLTAVKTWIAENQIASEKQPNQLPAVAEAALPPPSPPSRLNSRVDSSTVSGPSLKEAVADFMSVGSSVADPKPISNRSKTPRPTRQNASKSPTGSKPKRRM